MSVAATVISSGDELLSGATQDSNGPCVAAALRRQGIEVRGILVVGDDPRSLQEAIAESLRHSRVVVVTGGLGPTADDRTRLAVARSVGRELEPDEACRAHVESRLRSRGVAATRAQLSQAMLPSGATVFPNSCGTACGFACETPDGWVLALPGVPGEMRAMLEQAVLPFLAEALGLTGVVLAESVQLFPVPESAVDRRVVDMTMPGRNPAVGITVSEGIVSVRLSARADGEAEARRMLERDVEEVERRFGHLAFGRGAATLGSALGAALEETGGTLAVAESVTGGLIGSMLVDVPGMSRFLLADVVAYSDEAKVRQLGVPRGAIEAHGAVSPVVAELMACGCCRLTGADLGISTTGIAGPTGATPDKPVGLVYVGISLSGRSEVHELRLHGDRRTVKDRAAKHALNFARLALIGPDSEPPAT